MRAWLKDHGMAGQRDLVAPDDYTWMLEFRELLRTMLLQNNHEPAGPHAVRMINRLAQEMPLAVRVDAATMSLVPVASGMRGALSIMLAIAFAASVDGSWSRLKVCVNDGCRWAFYDRSKNRSAKWCNMAVCGNRTKARNYRRRHSPGLAL